MSHRAPWNCSTCGHQLGVVVGGALEIWAPKPMSGPERLAVVCPRCGATNIWRHMLKTGT